VEFVLLELKGEIGVGMMRLDVEDGETKVASTVARFVGVPGVGEINNGEKGGSEETVEGSELSEVYTEGGS